MTNAFAAKRALIARLKQLAEPGGPIAAQVAYAWPGAVEQIVVYGGGVTFSQPGEQDMVDGRRRLVFEEATLGLHIRVSVSPPPPNGIEDTDVLAEHIGDAIGVLLADEPDVCGEGSTARIVGGQGDYSPIDDAAVSTLSYRISVESYLTEQQQ